MDALFLELGFSWTLAKVLPYILMLLIGVAIIFFLKKQKLWIRLFFMPIPFFIYFIFFPIYQGDFSNEMVSMKWSKADPFNENSLSVLAIPGCPFCYESIKDLRQMRKRNSKLTIDFYVYTDDSTKLDWYREEGKGEIAVHILPTSNKRVPSISNGSFPTFVFRENKTLYVWSNNGFGVRAKDYIERK